jgi:prepilin-type N-terminal cleavage/methylation domain-containing protein
MIINKTNKVIAGFTLVELLVVISIIAVIIGVTMSNLVGARGRARDSVRKTNVAELKNALRLYYNDFQSYPASNNTPNTAQIIGCGTSATVAACPSAPCTENEFSRGGTNCASTTVYMKRLPRDTTGTLFEYRYYQVAGGDDFCLSVPLENAADTGITASQAKCASACGANCTGTNYCMCAD